MGNPVGARALADVRSIARLGGPLLINNLSLAGMAFADTVMAGQLGARALAGLAIGVAWFHLFFIIGLGTLMALSPVVAHAHGAGDAAGVARYLRQAWWLVLGLSIVLVWMLWQVDWILPTLGIAPEILPIASGYAKAISAGMPAVLGFLALRFASEGMGRTRPMMYLGCGALLFNIAANWVLIYGKFGMPQLGAIGCAVATAIGYWLEFAGMLLVMRYGRHYRHLRAFAALEWPRWRVLRELLRLGTPIAANLSAESGMFVAAAFLVGGMGATMTAAHQIALNYATFTFMVPLAISAATTIHVGHLLGAGRPAAARFAGAVGIACCAGVMLLAASSMLLFNAEIAALYTRDAQVQSAATSLLLVAALFQLFDGLQVGAAGALRGFKDTAVPMLFSLLSYWAVGFPLAYFTGVHLQRGPQFVWYGLTAGLMMAATLQVARYRYVSRRVAQLAIGPQRPVLTAT
jgi:multidrug resistance protein, MATE family